MTILITIYASLAIFTLIVLPWRDSRDANVKVWHLPIYLGVAVMWPLVILGPVLGAILIGWENIKWPAGFITFLNKTVIPVRNRKGTSA